MSSNPSRPAPRRGRTTGRRSRRAADAFRYAGPVRPDAGRAAAAPHRGTEPGTETGLGPYETRYDVSRGYTMDRSILLP
jgi:hypothetical protein